jgi:8-oxo-dGTP diphosphatase
MPNTAPERQRVEVAAAVILDSAGRCLVSYRSAAQHQGDRWEFPGGKLEAGESADQALARELFEELDIVIDGAVLLRRDCHDYPDKSVAVSFFEVTQWRGEPAGKQGQPINWVAIESLDAERFPAANRALIAQLQQRAQL